MVECRKYFSKGYEVNKRNQERNEMGKTKKKEEGFTRVELGVRVSGCLASWIEKRDWWTYTQLDVRCQSAIANKTAPKKSKRERKRNQNQSSRAAGRGRDWSKAVVDCAFKWRREKTKTKLIDKPMYWSTRCIGRTVFFVNPSKEKWKIQDNGQSNGGRWRWRSTRLGPKNSCC